MDLTRGIMILPSHLADRLAVMGFSVCVCLLACPSVCVVAVLTSARCSYSWSMRAAPIRGRTRTLHDVSDLAHFCEYLIHVCQKISSRSVFKVRPRLGSAARGPPRWGTVTLSRYLMMRKLRVHPDVCSLLVLGRGGVESGSRHRFGAIFWCMFIASLCLPCCARLLP